MKEGIYLEELIQRAKAGDDASNLNNADCVCGFGERPNIEVLYCFNQLVDPEQVASVTIDGRTYTRNH